MVKMSTIAETHTCRRLRNVVDSFVDRCLWQVIPDLLLLLPARRYASAGNSDRNVSVRPSVRHAPVLCQNEES